MCKEKTFPFENNIKTHDLVVSYTLNSYMHFFKCTKCSCLFAGNDDYKFMISHPYLHDIEVPSCGTKITVKKFLSSYMKKANIKDSFKCGLFSGFPICCILWFTFVKGSLISDELYNIFSNIHGNKDDFIRCPYCLRNSDPYIDKHDRYINECADVSFFKAVQSWVIWRNSSNKIKKIYNECADKTWTKSQIKHGKY
jgi:DNA-directed RNA polymerase subunit RPC12/RpoP